MGSQASRMASKVNSKRSSRASSSSKKTEAIPHTPKSDSSHVHKPSTIQSNTSNTSSPNYNNPLPPVPAATTENAPKISPKSSEMPPAQNTVPCQYRTGKTLGSGTYAIVKEAIHIKTGKYYACKVINKKLMEGREYMVRNEIAVLKRVSKGHPNIVTLHDYFETSHNLYLCFDLCTGGELFDRICAKGNYYEADAASLVRTILKAVEYIHSCGIVHRDLKPENLLFKDKNEDADIMIADFGLSRIMEEEKLQLLTEICGTPGYMAPEIFKKTGHSKPVDMWAMGVITYFLLCGYTPFDRDTQEEEMKAIIAGDFKFEPEEYWQNVSEQARDFVTECLTIDPQARPTASEALKHRWIAAKEPYFVPSADDPSGPADLLPTVQKGFNARKTFRKAVLGMMAMKRLTMLSQPVLPPHVQELADNIHQYKEDSKKEEINEEQHVVHHHNVHGTASDEDTDDYEDNLKRQDDLSPTSHAALADPKGPPVAQLAQASIVDGAGAE